jgi:cation:H+ antiporter
VSRSSGVSLLKDLLWFVGVLLLAGQWIVVHVLHPPLTPEWEATLSGLGIFGAAFLLSWGAELAQLEISQALALAFLALVAVLPEYAVDIYLAWTAAKDPSYTAYAAANMTGANRILIGLGWPVVLLCYWAKTKKKEIRLEQEQRIELVTLVVATIYAFLIPLKRTFSLLDTVILIGLFGVYIIRSSQAHHVHPALEGPPAHVACLPRPVRRVITLALFLLPAYAIVIAAEPFANGLLHSARRLGIEEFILIQWLAPLASESPEFIVAILFALRRNPGASLGTLVSSKVNQWTLLIGMLPLAYAISGGSLSPMHLDGRQAEEILLTAAQSILAIVILANWSFGIWEGVLLLSLFVTQLLMPIPWIRIGFSILYLVITFGYLASKSYRTSLVDLLIRGWRS